MGALIYIEIEIKNGKNDIEKPDIFVINIGIDEVLELNIKNDVNLVSNSNEMIAKYENGKVVAQNIGKTTMIFRDSRDIIYEYHIAVVNAQETININDSYTCKVGESFEIDVEISGNLARYGGATIKDSNIAIVENASTQPKCINCRNIKVSCNKEGTTTLTVKSANGTTKNATIKVS